MNLNSEIIEYRKNFYNIYHNSLKLFFQTYEKERLVLYNKCKRIKNISNAILLLILCVIVFAPYLYKLIGLFAYLIVLLLEWYFLESLKANNYPKILKSKCLPDILHAFGNIKAGSANISDSDLTASELFSEYDKISIDDCFNGKYKGVDFDIMESKLYSSGMVVFSGVLFKIKSNKNIKAVTIITPKYDDKIKNSDFSSIVQKYLVIVMSLYTLPSSLMTIVAILFLIINARDLMTGLIMGSFLMISFFTLLIPAVFVFGFITVVNLYNNNKTKLKEKIKLEDIDFEKQYKVDSQDQVEARYLITPLFMERFKNLKTAFQANSIKCSFYGDSLIFAISTNKNVFEIAQLNEPLTDVKTMEKFFDEMISIYLMIDYFKFNQHTGL